MPLQTQPRWIQHVGEVCVCLWRKGNVPTTDVKRDALDEQRRSRSIGAPPSLYGGTLLRHLSRRHFLHDELESVVGFCVVNLARTDVAVQPCDAPAVGESDWFLLSGEHQDCREEATENNVWWTH